MNSLPMRFAALTALLALGCSQDEPASTPPADMTPRDVSNGGDMTVVADVAVETDQSTPPAPDLSDDLLDEDFPVVDASPDLPATDVGTDVCSDCPRTPVFVNSWGGLGTDPGQFVEPSSVELQSDGTVIVAGHEDRIQRFTVDGTLIDIIGQPGTGDGEFNHPHGLAVDRQRGDLIYVGDQENGRVQVFDSDGQFVRRWGEGLFDHIHDVGIDRVTGELFVPDLDLHIVRKFSPTGELVATWGELGSGPGQFDGPWGLSTDSAGFVYVGDTNNDRIQKLDRDGNFVAEWTEHDGTPFVKPTGVYVDDDDTVYVCDSLAELIVLFDADGNVLETWDLAQIYGERSEPEDVVIDADGKHIYVAEVFEHRVLHLRRPDPDEML